MKLVICSTAMMFVASIAYAQSGTTTEPRNPQNPAISSANGNSAKPVPGANSFTESQAKSHIEAKGFTNVSNLTKGQDGIWRGKGLKGGASQNVALDYQGNVFGE